MGKQLNRWPRTSVLADIRVSQTIDSMIDAYVCWREEACFAAAAYGAVEFFGGAERATAYAAFLAALDREEKAAAVYALLVSDLMDLYVPERSEACNPGAAERSPGADRAPDRP